MPKTVIPISRQALAALLSSLILLAASIIPAAAEESGSASLPVWRTVIDVHRDRLRQVQSDQTALDLFVTAIGRAVEVHDVAATLAAKGISPHVARDLMVPEITKSAQRLIAALIAWDVAERMLLSLKEQSVRTAALTTPSQAAWLTANGPFAPLQDVIRLWDERDTSAAAGVAAAQLAQAASQRAMEDWWQLRTWKERVRKARGQARLCGTWQWIIHNHQRHHEERKLSLVFPPGGADGLGLPGLSETVVLGDAVYLRWETDGRVQEDSLLFSKQGQRLEGTFVNSQGGWGAITGKRTAACTP